jgi:hypothetical protein
MNLHATCPMSLCSAQKKAPKMKRARLSRPGLASVFAGTNSAEELYSELLAR